MSKRIGILTTGGDCSGLNSVIRGAGLRAMALGYTLLGIRRGFRGLSTTGLSKPDYFELDASICDETMLLKSGSILLSDTKWMSAEIQKGRTVEDVKQSIIDGYRQLKLDGLICVGGDGSLKLLNELTSNNDELRVIFVPKTIDNDVNYTDYAVGFQTSVKVAVEAIENIRSTAKSHERTMIVEVMGRDAGFIALYAGLASGADVILVPEFGYNLEKIKEAGFECRSVTLGHIQRGGETCISDRLLGTLLGVEAINLISNGNFGKFLAFSENKLRIMDIREVVKNVNATLKIDDKYVNVARDLGVYVGEF